MYAKKYSNSNKTVPQIICKVCIVAYPKTREYFFYYNIEKRTLLPVCKKCTITISAITGKKDLVKKYYKEKKIKMIHIINKMKEKFD
jgi:hypothetical protein